MSFRSKLTSRWENMMDARQHLNVIDMRIDWLSEDWAREWLEAHRLRELRAKLDRLIASLEEQEDKAA